MKWCCGRSRVRKQSRALIFVRASVVESLPISISRRSQHGVFYDLVLKLYKVPNNTVLKGIRRQQSFNSRFTLRNYPVNWLPRSSHLTVLNCFFAVTWQLTSIETIHIYSCAKRWNYSNNANMSLIIQTIEYI